MVENGKLYIIEFIKTGGDKKHKRKNNYFGKAICCIDI